MIKNLSNHKPNTIKKEMKLFIKLTKKKLSKFSIFQKCFNDSFEDEEDEKKNKQKEGNEIEVIIIIIIKQ